MGWYEYYKLYEKYKGEIHKAKQDELDYARRSNPNDPITAREIAERKWRIIQNDRR